MYANYLVRNQPALITTALLNKIENVMHIAECNTDHLMHYLILNLAKCFSESKCLNAFI